MALTIDQMFSIAMFFLELGSVLAVIAVIGTIFTIVCYIKEELIG